MFLNKEFLNLNIVIFYFYSVTNLLIHNFRYTRDNQNIFSHYCIEILDAI